MSAITTMGIGVDVGGTKILTGSVDAAGDVTSLRRTATPVGSVRELADTIAAEIAETKSATTDAVGIAVAGRVDGDGRVLTQSANLALTNVPLAELVEARTGLRIVLVNDADAALWGEHRLGAAATIADVVMLTVGTGVGGSALVGGRLLRGAYGAASEFGHMIVEPNGLSCGCGARGCLDRYGSGRALWRFARDAYAEARPSDPMADNLADAADRGVSYAIEAFDTLGMWLGRGLANILAALDPGRVVLAGGVASSGMRLVQAVRANLDRELALRGVSASPDVVVGDLGESAGVIGASMLAPLQSAGSGRDAA